MNPNVTNDAFVAQRNEEHSPHFDKQYKNKEKKVKIDGEEMSSNVDTVMLKLGRPGNFTLMQIVLN